MLPPKLSVNDLFPASSEAQWRAAAAKALGVDDPGARLRRQGLDGIQVEAVHATDGFSGRDAVESREPGFAVVAEHVAHAGLVPSVREAAQGGVDGHLLRVDEGSEVDWPEVLAAAGRGAWIDARLPSSAFATIESRLSNTDASARGCLGIDPLGWLAADRSAEDAFPEWVDRGGRIARTLGTTSSGLRAFAVDTLWAHRAGASDTQEVAIALAGGLELLRALERAGMELADAVAQIHVRLHLDARFFLSIAKGRAWRQLWSQLLRASGVESPEMTMHARQGERGVSVLDPWVNVLRGTASVFGGALGGANFVSVQRYDERLAEKDPAAARLARNTALILREESHLDRVADPAGGSHALENWTGQLAERAYELLTRIEERGGLAHCLQSRWIDEEIATIRRKRRERLRTRREPRTGVSEFPLSGETFGASGSETDDWHLDADFEELRLAADIHRATCGGPPTIAIARWGSLAELHARQLWLQNLVAVGGVEARLLALTEDVEGLASAPGRGPVILCTSDARLAAGGEACVDALKAAGYDEIWIAGRPQGEPLAAASGYVHVGIDVVEWLGRLHRRLGVGA